MRANYAGFALAFGMGLIVLLIGFLALSAAGLVELAPAAEVVAAQADSAAIAPRQFGEYGPGPRPVPPDTAAMASRPYAAGNAVAIAAGDALFKNNCAQCHAINEKVVGPALAGITRRRQPGWIISWVHNPAKVVASGDDYAVKLFNDNGQQQMPAFPQLSDEDITSILSWVTSQEGTAATVTVAAR